MASPSKGDLMAKAFDPDRFLASNRGFRLSKRATEIDPLYDSDEDFERQRAGFASELSELQEELIASRTHALLAIFQGMDTSGKDGAIKHVLSGVNPQGCAVASFKRPSDEELDHDFLWRVHARMPGRGMIGVFNRSYYEEVLVVRVHPTILEAQRIPGVDAKPGKNFWRSRYEDIRSFEQYMDRQGTSTVKFFLHLSKDEQRKRLLARLEDPSKRWKFQIGDVKERRSWRDYQAAYEACIEATHSKRAPWYVIPADDKKNARLIVSQILIGALSEMKLAKPKLDKESLAKISEIRKELGG